MVWCGVVRCAEVRWDMCAWFWGVWCGVVCLFYVCIPCGVLWLFYVCVPVCLLCVVWCYGEADRARAS